MTDKQLEALAIYRTHKHCQCQDCETARRILKDYDAAKWQSKPADWGDHPGNAPTGRGVADRG